MVTEERVKTILIQALELNIDPDDLDLDIPLYEIGLDSVSTLSVVVGLEDVFGIEVADEELTEDLFRSIKSLSQYIDNKLSESKSLI